MQRLYRSALAFILFLIALAAPASGGEEFPEYPLIREYYLLDYRYPEKEEQNHQLRELLRLAPPEAHDVWKTILDGMVAAARGGYDESLAVFDKVLADSAIHDGLARAFVLTRKSQSLHAADRYAEAVAILDNILATYGDRPESPYCELKAAVLRYKYHSLVNAGDLHAAQAPLTALVEGMRSRPEAAVQLQITYAMLYVILSAERSSDSHHWDAAIQFSDDLISRFKDRPEPELRLQVARAMLSRATNMTKRVMARGALETCAELREYLADRDDPGALTLFAESCLQEGVVWQGSGQPGKALAVYDTGLARLAGRKETGLRKLSATLKINKGTVLGFTGRPEEMVALCGETADELVADGNQQMLPLALEALFVKINGYGLQNKTEEQLAVLASIAKEYGANEAPDVQLWVLRAMTGIGDLRLHRGDRAGAAEAYRDAVERYGRYADPAIAEWIKNTRTFLATLDTEEKSGAE